MSNKLWNPMQPEVPFDAKGNMLSFPEHWKMKDGGGWRHMTPFMAKMLLVGIYRGRSAAHVILMDENHKTFPIFLADLEALLRGPGIAKGATPVLEWVPTKKGQNYGIKWSGQNYQED